MNPEKPSDQFDIPKAPREELIKNPPRDGELFVHDALSIYVKHIASKTGELEPTDETAERVWQDFLNCYAGSFETRSDFIHEKAADLGWYDALYFACEMGNIPTAVVSLSIPNAFNYLSRYYDVLESIDTDRLHAFKKPDIQPPDSQIRLVQKGDENDE